MIYIFVILLRGWCRTRVRRARLVSNAFLYTVYTLVQSTLNFPICCQSQQLNPALRSTVFLLLEEQKSEFNSTKYQFEQNHRKLYFVLTTSYCT